LNDDAFAAHFGNHIDSLIAARAGPRDRQSLGGREGWRSGFSSFVFDSAQTYCVGMGMLVIGLAPLIAVSRGSL